MNPSMTLSIYYLHKILSDIQDFRLILPEEEAWDLESQVVFLNSFLKGMPLGSLTTTRMQQGEVVIDGFQRLNCLFKAFYFKQKDDIVLNLKTKEFVLVDSVGEDPFVSPTIFTDSIQVIMAQRKLEDEEHKRFLDEVFKVFRNTKFPIFESYKNDADFLNLMYKSINKQREWNRFNDLMQALEKVSK